MPQPYSVGTDSVKNGQYSVLQAQGQHAHPPTFNLTPKEGTVSSHGSTRNPASSESGPGGQDLNCWLVLSQALQPPGMQCQEWGVEMEAPKTDAYWGRQQ